jgi:hypothetical protein
MVKSLGRNASSEGRNNEHLSNFERNDGNAASQGSEVVFVGMPDFLDKAVFAQALDGARDLAGGLAGENLAEISVAESVDVEFATSNGSEKVKVIAMEEVEASIGSVVVAGWAADVVEVFDGIGGIIDSREELQIAMIAARHDFGEGLEAVDSLLDRGDLVGSGPVTVYHLTVVFEQRDIIGRCLDAKGNALLIVHFDSGPSHMVFDPSALDAGMEVIAQFVLASFCQLAPQEGGYMIRFDGMDGGAHQFFVDRSKVWLPLEDNIGGIFGLHDAPVIAGGKGTYDGTILPDDLIDLPVKPIGVDGAGQLLGSFGIVDLDEGIVQHGIADPFPVQFSRQFIMPIEVELQPEGGPGWDPQIAEAEVRQDEIEVVMQTLAGCRLEKGVTGLFVVPRFECGAGFHRREDMNHSRMIATLRDDGPYASLFTKVGLSDELNLQTMLARNGFGMLTQFQTKLIGPGRVTEHGHTKTATESCHSTRIAHINQRPGQDNPVITGQLKGYFLSMTFNQVLHALTLQLAIVSNQNLVPAMPG